MRAFLLATLLALSVLILAPHASPVSARHCAAISPWELAANDDDCDEFTQTAELYINTDPIQACARTSTAYDEPTVGNNPRSGDPWKTPIDPWPYDFDDNQFVNVSDYLKYNYVFGLTVTPTSPLVYVPGMGWTDVHRFDLNTSGLINVSDLLKFNHVMNQNCSFIPLNKNIWLPRWYQQPCNPTCDYVSWITLSNHRDVSGAPQWGSAIDEARADWNVTPNTAYIQPLEDPSPEADIHFYANDYGCWEELIHDNVCVSPGFGAQVWLIGGNPTYDFLCLSNCQSPVPTIWYVIIAFAEKAATDQIPDVGFKAIFRRSTVAHELGHAVELAHDQSVANPEVQESNHLCVTPTIMDYDCYIPIDPVTRLVDWGTASSWANVLLGPQPGTHAALTMRTMTQTGGIADVKTTRHDEATCRFGAVSLGSRYIGVQTING